MSSVTECKKGTYMPFGAVTNSHRVSDGDGALVGGMLMNFLHHTKDCIVKIKPKQK